MTSAKCPDGCKHLHKMPLSDVKSDVYKVINHYCDLHGCFLIDNIPDSECLRDDTIIIRIPRSGELNAYGMLGVHDKEDIIWYIERNEMVDHVSHVTRLWYEFDDQKPTTWIEVNITTDDVIVSKLIGTELRHISEFDEINETEIYHIMKNNECDYCAKCGTWNYSRFMKDEYGKHIPCVHCGN